MGYLSRIITTVLTSIVVCMGILVMGFASTLLWLIIGGFLGVSITKFKERKNEFTRHISWVKKH